AEDGIRDGHVTGVQTCALPISCHRRDWSTAGSHFGRSLELRHGEANRRGVALSLAGLARVALTIGEPARAARLLGAADALLEARSEERRVGKEWRARWWRDG